MKPEEAIKKLKKLINPVPDIGGLDIGSSFLRYINLSTLKMTKAELALTPGVVADGQVKNRSALVEALRDLHKKIAPPSKTINVIVTAGSDQIYTQTFSLPFSLEGPRLREAIGLNLEMISPIDKKSAYYDSQRLGETTGGQADFMGAFVDAAIIDQFTIALEEANFNIVAFEFPALSLGRLIKQLSEVDFLASHILLDISEEGANFLILVRGQLYFNYFVSWKNLEEERVGDFSAPTVEAVILRELKRIVNFYGNRFGQPLATIVFSAFKPFPELEKLIKENFTLPLQIPALDAFPDLTRAWFPAVGAALRGLIPRIEDRLISLAAVGTEQGYFRSRLLNFVSSWRNVFVICLALILFLTGATDFLLIKKTQSLKSELAEISGRVDIQEVGQLQKDAREFNQLVAIAEYLEIQAIPRSPFFDRLNQLAGAGVTLDRIFIDTENRVAVSGRTSSETAALNFKNRVEKDDNFANVNLPLASLRPVSDGLVAFTLNFEITKQ